MGVCNIAQQRGECDVEGVRRTALSLEMTDTECTEDYICYNLAAEVSYHDIEIIDRCISWLFEAGFSRPRCDIRSAWSIHPRDIPDGATVRPCDTMPLILSHTGGICIFINTESGSSRIQPSPPSTARGGVGTSGTAEQAMDQIPPPVRLPNR